MMESPWSTPTQSEIGEAEAALSSSKGASDLLFDVLETESTSQLIRELGDGEPSLDVDELSSAMAMENTNNNNNNGEEAENNDLNRRNSSRSNDGPPKQTRRSSKSPEKKAAASPTKGRKVKKSKEPSVLQSSRTDSIGKTSKSKVKQS
jgi:hypothetical protein